MTHIRRHSLVLLFVGLFIAALSVVGTPPASAAQTCYNGTCRGLAPQSTYAPDGVTRCDSGNAQITEFTSGSFRYQMRYSPQCQAVWARITTLAGAPSTACYGTWAQLHTYTPQRVYAYGTMTRASCGTGAVSWTTMSPFDGVLVQVCGEFSGGLSAPRPGQPCTGFH